MSIQILAIVHSDLDLWNMTLTKGHDSPLCYGQQLCQILSRSNMTRTQILAMCALWHWPWRYDLCSKSRHTHGLEATILWYIIQIQHGCNELWPGHIFWLCVHCKIDFRDMTLDKGHDTTLNHGQQFRKLLSRPNIGVRSSYDMDRDFGYICALWHNC